MVRRLWKRKPVVPSVTQLEGLVENDTAPTLITARDGRILYRNRAALRVYKDDDSNTLTALLHPWYRTRRRTCSSGALKC